MASSPSVRAARIGVLIATLIGGCEVNPTYIACQEDSNCPPGYFCGAWGFCGAGAAASDGGVDAGPPADAGADAGIGLGTDAGTTDAGGPDAGPPDAGPTDAGPQTGDDAGPQTGDDAGPQTGIDAGPTDAGATDAGGADAGGADAGGADAGNTDAGTRPECNSGVYPDGGTVFLADGGGVAYDVNCAAGEICALGGHCATPEYSVDGGIVTDNVTGLQWQQDVSSAPCAGSPCTWTAAISYCESLGTSWQLPTLPELFTLLDTASSPKIDPNAFPGVQAGPYWTDTPYESTPGTAWFVNFGTGEISNITEAATASVRCVR